MQERHFYLMIYVNIKMCFICLIWFLIYSNEPALFKNFSKIKIALNKLIKLRYLFFFIFIY